MHTNHPFHESLTDHLAQWGLRHFTSDADYLACQRATLSAEQVRGLHAAVERKRQGTREDEIAFYDVTADPAILPVLYSQRYEYYEAVGLRVASCLEPAALVLDVGCGTGILTTFYAKLFPHMRFVGVDRSPASVAAGSAWARAAGLENVRFECLDCERHDLEGAYDTVLATHALVQAEFDPGLPSLSWRSFARANDDVAQSAFEFRTGVGARLDQVVRALSPAGRLVVFEKTRQLARKVPFQRALARRGLHLCRIPEPVRYCLVEEVADDGPLYVLSRDGRDALPWDEAPEADEGPPLDLQALSSVPRQDGPPLYENHWPSAQAAWASLVRPRVRQEDTRQEADGRQLHVELGVVGEYPYLYCANTFDQRQLVIGQVGQEEELAAYFREILNGPG